MEKASIHEVSVIYPGSLHMLFHYEITRLLCLSRSKNYSIKAENNSSPGELFLW